MMAKSIREPQSETESHCAQESVLGSAIYAGSSNTSHKFKPRIVLCDGKVAYRFCQSVHKLICAFPNCQDIERPSGSDLIVFLNSYHYIPPSLGTTVSLSYAY